MNLEDLVCTFSQAKRLRELGVDEDAYFHWGYGSGPERIIIRHSHSMCDDPRTAKHFESVPAYSCGELGAMMLKICEMYTQQTLNYNGYDEYHFLCSGNEFVNKTAYPTEAQARAEFLIYLLEYK